MSHRVHRSPGRRLGLLALLVLLGPACTLDALFFSSTRQEGPYDLPTSIVPRDRYDPETFLVSADGTRVHAMLVRDSAKDPARGTTAILFCHGNGGNLGSLNHFRRVETFYQMGYKSLPFDYRGYGRSAGQPTEPGLYEDADAALAYLRAQPGVDPARIVLYGHSLGAAVCTELAVRNVGRIRALILEAPFRSVDDMVKDSARASLNADYLTDLRFDNFAKIDKIGVPLYILYGTADTYLSPRYGQELFDQAQAPKTFWLVPDADHLSIPGQADTPERATYLQAVTRFLDTLPP